MMLSPRSVVGSALLALSLVAGCAADAGPDTTGDADLTKSTKTLQSTTACKATSYDACLAKNGKTALACAETCPDNCFTVVRDCLTGEGGYACAKRCTLKTEPTDLRTMCAAAEFDSCHAGAKTPDQKAACAKFCPTGCRASVAKCLREEGGGITCARRDCNSSI
jgi:hypothetical protein